MSQKIVLIESDKGVRPCNALVISEAIDMSATENIDILVPNNLNLLVRSARLVTRKKVGTISVAPNVSLQQYDPALIASRVAAVLSTSQGSNKDLTFTAVTKGTGGNSITVAYVVAGNNTVLSVSVSSNAITVNVATGSGGAATSTGAQILAAILASAPAVALITAALKVGNDGTGVVGAMSATALAGGTNPENVQTLVTGGSLSTTDAQHNVQSLALNAATARIYGGSYLRLAKTGGTVTGGGAALSHDLIVEAIVTT